MSQNILYIYGKNSTGELVKAGDANKGIHYVCPVCNQSLILRKGLKKCAHFAHKSLSPNCTPETALHYIFKTLLCGKIQAHIDRQLPLYIQWHCRDCMGEHTGNLLKKASKVRLEHNLGTCKPDIALLDEQGKTVAVIEVIVTHEPEEAALDYYKTNQIALVTYELKSDEDFNRLDLPVLKPNNIGLCTNPKCLKCGDYMQNKRLHLIDSNCLECRAPMKVAAMRSNTLGLGFGDFSTSDIQLANQNGAFIKLQYSRSAQRSYDANTCTKCGCFVGVSFLSNYMYDSNYIHQELDAGHYCTKCASQ